MGETWKKQCREAQRVLPFTGPMYITSEARGQECGKAEERNGGGGDNKKKIGQITKEITKQKERKKVKEHGGKEQPIAGNQFQMAECDSLWP